MQRFGKVTFDWDEMKLSFPWQGEIREVQGVNCRREWDKENQKSGHQMSSLYGLLWKDESKGEEGNEGDLDQQQQRELEEVLKQIPEVIQEITSHPPERKTMHSIVLTKEAEPVSVHPYRYPYHHKEEIKRQVMEP